MVESIDFKSLSTDASPINNWATLSNCGKPLKLHILTYNRNIIRAENNRLRYSKNYEDTTMGNPHAKLLKLEIERRRFND